jgi:basic membrane lipoprotein Med (substrate-binding protein (PBP1-ABC) superfamily)
MKKMFAITLTVLILAAFSGSAFAANPVSKMATTKGGQHIAQCAQMMERGISSIANGSHICDHSE